jgi:hypothetical protein
LVAADLQKRPIWTKDAVSSLVGLVCRARDDDDAIHCGGTFDSVVVDDAPLLDKLRPAVPGLRCWPQHRSWFGPTQVITTLAFDTLGTRAAAAAAVLLDAFSKRQPTRLGGAALDVKSKPMGSQMALTAYST